MGAITIAEYQWNRPTSVIYPGGGRRELEYDGLMRLKNLSATDPGGNSLLDYSYSYDNSGNIETKSTEHGEYVYGYDAASRLTSADNPVAEDESYAYDAVGNRTNASNAEGEISHNANNELTMYGDIEFQYDANGNLTQKKLGNVAVNYVYNADNRLILVEDELSGAVVAEYYYDPFGRRLWKEVGGVKTYFFYSDEGLVAEFDGSGSEIRSYGYKPDSTWSTDPLWLKSGGQYYFYQNDHLGTPQKLVAQNGSVVWSATYSAFGEASVEIETVTNNLRFPGQYFDAEIGLHYNFQRYYDPGIGRYVSADPIGFGGGTANLYGYVKNSPLKFKDSRGLIPSWMDWGEEPPEVALFDSLKGDTFSVYATRFLLMLYLYHDTEVGSVFFNPKHPLYNPTKYPGKRWTDCITYVERVLRYAYNMTGQPHISKGVNNKAASGIHLAQYLRTQGWKIIYWNQDINHPSDGDLDKEPQKNEHVSAWKTYKNDKKYGYPVYVKVDDFKVINYNPTLETDPGYKNYYGMSDCPTPKDMTGYNKLKNVMFGVIMVRGATHNFLYSYGKTYEVHYDWPEGRHPTLYEAKDFQTLNWLDGILLVPPDNGVY